MVARPLLADGARVDVVSAPPAWATRLLEDVCAERGAEVPALTWRRSRTGTAQSSGHYNVAEHRIVVTAGRERRDQRLVLLHEIAHALTPGEVHGPRFWLVCWTLYRAHRVPIRYAQRREYGYKGAREGYRAARSRSS